MSKVSVLENQENWISLQTMWAIRDDLYPTVWGEMPCIRVPKGFNDILIDFAVAVKQALEKYPGVSNVIQGVWWPRPSYEKPPALVVQLVDRHDEYQSPDFHDEIKALAFDLICSSQTTCVLCGRSDAVARDHFDLLCDQCAAEHTLGYTPFFPAPDLDQVKFLGPIAMVDVLREFGVYFVGSSLDILVPAAWEGPLVHTLTRTSQLIDQSLAIVEPFIEKIGLWGCEERPLGSAVLQLTEDALTELSPDNQTELAQVFHDMLSAMNSICPQCGRSKPGELFHLESVSPLCRECLKANSEDAVGSLLDQIAQKSAEADPAPDMVFSGLKITPARSGRVWPNLYGRIRPPLEAIFSKVFDGNVPQFDIPQGAAVMVGAAMETLANMRGVNGRVVQHDGPLVTLIQFTLDGDWICYSSDAKPIEIEFGQFTMASLLCMALTAGSRDHQSCIFCGCDAQTPYRCGSHEYTATYDRDKCDEEAGPIIEVLETLDRKIKELTSARRVTAPQDLVAECNFLVPVPDMPSPDSTKSLDAAQILKSYADLKKPMPLLGAGWDADKLCEQLSTEFPWIDTSGLHAYLVLAQSVRPNSYFKSPNLLLNGPPGTAKSAFARRLAEIVGLPSYVHNCAGSSDARTFLGTARGWGNTTPGIVPTVMKMHGAANFLLVLEDLDRASASAHSGRISDAVLPYLEASTAKAVIDECFQANVDASAVSWTITCNSIDQMDQAILSRCRVVQVGRPEPKHFDAIHAGMLRAVAGEFGCEISALPDLDDDVVEMLFDAFQKIINLRELNKVYIRVLSVASRQKRVLQ
jgi:hypothetical protein